MFWIGLGIAVAGFCIAAGLESLDKEIKKGLQMMSFDVSKAHTEE